GRRGACEGDDTPILVNLHFYLCPGIVDAIPDAIRDPDPASYWSAAGTSRRIAPLFPADTLGPDAEFLGTPGGASAAVPEAKPDRILPQPLTQHIDRHF